MHLVHVHDAIKHWKPKTVIVDPVSSLTIIGLKHEVTSMLTRLIDFLKALHVTALFTSLTSAEGPAEQTDVGISSLMDTWIALRTIERNGRRVRGLTILKSRGMAHSMDVNELRFTRRGIELLDGDREPGPGLRAMAPGHRGRSERAQSVPPESEAVLSVGHRQTPRAKVAEQIKWK
jgi:circadian clock protein KaiC